MNEPKRNELNTPSGSISWPKPCPACRGYDLERQWCDHCKGTGDLSSEFEISMSERSLMVMSSNDLAKMQMEYDLFKKCAIGAGYSVEESINHKLMKTARFFKSNTEIEQSDKQQTK